MRTKDPDDAPATERQAVPRVVHLGYFDAAIEGVRTGITFDELRIHLATVGRDLARYAGRSIPSRRSPTHFWRTTRDTLLGLMQCGFVESRPLPSLNTSVSKHGSEKYTLGKGGKDLLHLSEAQQRDRLGASMLRTYPAFRRYLDRLGRGPVFVPDFTEGDMTRLKVTEGNWTLLPEEIRERVRATVGTEISREQCTMEVVAGVRSRLARRSGYSRKDLADAVNDAVARFVAYAEQLSLDATSLNVVHEWARQLFLIGSSRYVAEMPQGLLQWAASEIDESGNEPFFLRRTIPHVVPEVIEAMSLAYRALRREDTSLVEYYTFRGTAAFRARVCNEIVDSVTRGMVTGSIPNDLGLQPVAGAQWSPPPSEPPLRIAGRRYTVITCKQ